ncbi:lipocalin [Vibrio sp. 10N.286.49.B3]|uniref:lipocalin family protein n=1 Tax=Vibrio sp. 10N.286.49.B3 TaxID=1880855 RepID=UPI000C81A4E8|nr:lipocalin family protein [Vibrio sp. 10N.286.49.B3]PMH43758.1 lipocalin [Vibrio sp. 10N.286.49.B3]
MKKIILIFTALLLNGCLGMPTTVTPVSDFELNRYLGSWYEIARLDHSFERGLSQVSAQYQLKEDGGVQVINRGFSAESNEWQEAEGKAYFVDAQNQGYLKVSFFGPFYGSYIVFELDKQDYQYAFVSGPNLDYLWLLARTPVVEQEVIDKFMAMSRERGFDVENIILVEQSE